MDFSLCELEPLHADDVEEAAALAASALLHSPGYVFVFAHLEDASRRAALHWLFAANFRMRLSTGACRAAFASAPSGGAGRTMAAFFMLQPPDAGSLGLLSMVRHGLLAFPFRFGLIALWRLLALKHHAEAGGAAAAQAAGAGSLPLAQLERMVVRPEFQGRGLGTRLLREALAQADARGWAVVLGTQEARNVRFYQRLGFRVAASEPQGSYFGVSHNWFMLRPPPPPWARRPAAVHATAAASPHLLAFSHALAERLCALPSAPPSAATGRESTECAPPPPLPPPVPLPAALPPLIARLGCHLEEELTPSSTLHRDPTVSLCFCTGGRGLDLLRGVSADGSTPTAGGLPEVWGRFGMEAPTGDLLHAGRQATLVLIPRHTAGKFAAEPATYSGLERFVERRYPQAAALLARDLPAMRRVGGPRYYRECEAQSPTMSFTDPPPPVFRYKELQAARAALGTAADGPGGVPAWRVRQFLYCELRCNAAFDGSGETPSGFPELFVENVPMETVFAAGGVVVELGAAAHFPNGVLEKHAEARYTPFYAARAAGTADSAAAALTPPPPATGGACKQQ